MFSQNVKRILNIFNMCRITKESMNIPPKMSVKLSLKSWNWLPLSIVLQNSIEMPDFGIIF